MIKNQIGSEYLNRLQGVYHEISKRGILVSTPRLAKASTDINSAIARHISIIANSWGCHVYVGAANDDGSDSSVNLNSSSGKRTPLLKLQSLGYIIPKVAARNEETGEYESKESLAELALQKMLGTNQFNILGGDPVIKAMLAIRELVTLKNRYINANLYSKEFGQYYLSNYNCAGTTSGRRSSRKHTFGFGNNAQNFPKHGELARIYRRCLVARPGHILLMVDQMQAEDWPVSALANNTAALGDLINGIDRHKKLAMAIFRLSENHYTEKEWKDSIERYLGKKTRHANNYGMKGGTMSDSLAKEGISMTAAQCQGILDIVNQVDPSVKGVFHYGIEQQLYNTRTLQTPFGRERQFFGMRGGDNSGNQKIFREAYSYIPQSTVGDNTGFAVYELETGYPDSYIIQEGHDSIIQEIPATADSIWEYTQRTIRAFNRPVRFPNGIEFTIPVEGEIAYDFYSTITFKNGKTNSKKLTDLTYNDIQASLHKLNELREKELHEEAEDKLGVEL